eukprot:scaffold23479_cov70-Phaeocystis_antarctica.AAC.5
MPGRRLGRTRCRRNRASSPPSGSECRRQTPRSRRPEMRERRPAGRRRTTDTTDMATPEKARP